MSDFYTIILGLATGWVIGLYVAQWREERRLSRIPFPTGICGEGFRIVISTPPVGDIRSGV